MTIRRFTTEDILAGEKVRAIAYVQKRDISDCVRRLIGLRSPSDE